MSRNCRPIRRTVTRLVLVLSILAPAGAAFAVQCDVVATPLSFGTYDPFSAVPLTATSNLNISCKPPRKVFVITVQLSPGSGSYAQRTMTSATGEQMLYNVYADPSYLTILGDGTGGSQAPSGTVTKNAPWNLTLFGRIPALQNLVPGVYSDILTATILW